MAETTTTKKRTTTKKTTTTAKKEAETVVETPIVKEEPVVASAPAPTVQMVVEQKAEPIRILYIDSAIPNNEIKIGQGRSIFGSGKIFAVQRDQFEGEFMTSTIMELMEARKLIVLSGLSDEDRKLYNCYYREGEVLKSEGMFDFFFNMSTEEAAEKFEALCPEHRQFVATRFIDAYERHDNRVTRDKVEALNKISKENDPDGLFTPIVKDINENIG